jgi:hypothetical protein
MDKHKEAIESNDVGSLEKVLGEYDPLFRNEDKNVKNLADSTQCFDSDGNELAIDPVTKAPVDNVISAQDLINADVIAAKLNDIVKESGRKKDVPVEVEITHLKHPENGRIFEANEHMLRRKDLIPCDKYGNKVYDNRKLRGFN